MTLTDHYWGVYALLHSMSQGETKIPAAVVHEVAWASQAVDEYQEHRIQPHIQIVGEDGKPLDFILPTPTQSYRYWSAVHLKSRDVWQPFHFPPNGKGGAVVEPFPDWLVGVFLQAVSNLIYTLKNAPDGEDGPMGQDVQYRAHILGILWHAMWDSVSHQGFAPIRDKFNAVGWPWYLALFQLAPNVGHADAGADPDLPGVEWVRTWKKPPVSNQVRWKFCYTLTTDLLGQRLDLKGGKAFLDRLSFGDGHENELLAYLTTSCLQGLGQFKMEPMKSKYTVKEWYSTRHATFLTAATAQRINSLAVVSRGI